eukprot:TRINITY_DN4687_c0_g1_i2.p1 TRINITY_DN4687_c0_g1~~TRINITY_DN4687_c0_g1_i2.p1  ORF type:complete len:643 (+),score=132.01 TRINITY_DN4687_c0_g1_i2:306-2234(+)
MSRPPRIPLGRARCRPLLNHRVHQRRTLAMKCFQRLIPTSNTLQTHLNTFVRQFENKAKSLQATVAQDTALKDIAERRKTTVEAEGVVDPTNRQLLEKALSTVSQALLDMSRCTQAAMDGFRELEVQTSHYVKGELALADRQRRDYDKAKKKLVQEQAAKTKMSLSNHTDKQIFHVEKKVNEAKDDLERQTAATHITLTDVDRLNACFEMDLLCGLLEKYHRLFVDGEAVIRPLFGEVQTWRKWAAQERLTVASQTNMVHQIADSTADNILLEGLISIRGGQSSASNKKKWKKRYVVLKPKYLLCFSPSSSASVGSASVAPPPGGQVGGGKKRKFKASIQLVQCCANPSKKRLYSIALGFAGNTVFIATSTEEEKSKWLSALRNCIDNYEEHDVMEEADEMAEIEAAATTPDVEFQSEPGGDGFSIRQEGILMKKGAKRRNWKTRLFVMVVDQTSQTLTYYQNEKSKSTDKPKGVINLGAASNIYRHSDKPYGFCIEMSGRTYYICSAKNSDMDMWMSLIRKAMRYVRHLKGESTLDPEVSNRRKTRMISSPVLFPDADTHMHCHEHTALPPTPGVRPCDSVQQQQHHPHKYTALPPTPGTRAYDDTQQQHLSSPSDEQTASYYEDQQEDNEENPPVIPQRP